MPNPYFRFKQFNIFQEKSAMKVGTDGVLLGAWTNPANAKKILDIGTGTGVIALMMAQKSSATITGIDIDEGAFEEATFNCKQSPWSDRINIQLSSLQDFYLTNANFDLIVSNPPFFENSLKAGNESRTNARHTNSLTPDELVPICSKLLSNTGRCCFIIPAESFPKYTKIAQQCKMFLSRILWVKPTPAKAPKRVILEISMEQLKLEENWLIIEEFGRHKYSDDFKNLTKDFYLNI